MATSESRFSSNFIEVEVDVSDPNVPMGNQLVPPGTTPQPQAQPQAQQVKSTNPFSAVDPEEEQRVSVCWWVK